jgi:hypothetical protein
MNGTCTHIKVTGVRCGSPALKGEQFCYFHQNAIRSVRRPKQSRLHPIAMIEDEESIQYALMEVINALMKNTIDLKRATLILRALHIAVKNASRVKFEVQGKHSVTQVPEYAPPPDIADLDETTEIDLPFNAWIPPKSERQVMEEKHRAQKLQDWKAQQAQIRADLERARPGTHPETAPLATVASPDQAGPEPSRRASASVGTEPLVRPGREAAVPAAEADKSAQAPLPIAVPPHNFKPTQTTRTAPTTPTNSGTPIRKPPQTATAAPNQRKSSAHAGVEHSRRSTRHG